LRPHFFSSIPARSSSFYPTGLNNTLLPGARFTDSGAAGAAGGTGAGAGPEGLAASPAAAAALAWGGSDGTLFAACIATLPFNTAPSSMRMRLVTISPSMLLKV
jgi:hypothetical protein